MCGFSSDAFFLFGGGVARSLEMGWSDALLKSEGNLISVSLVL